MEILDCSFDVYQRAIKKDTGASPFLAVMADETTDGSGQTQLVIVFRYLKGAKVFESFWGYFKMVSVDAKSLANVILSELNVVLEGDVAKLIAQTYDGANVIRGSKNVVRTQILEKYPNAHFVHCYAHQLKLIGKNACGMKRGSIENAVQRQGTGRHAILPADAGTHRSQHFERVQFYGQITSSSALSLGTQRVDNAIPRLLRIELADRSIPAVQIMGNLKSVGESCQKNDFLGPHWRLLNNPLVNPQVGTIFNDLLIYYTSHATSE